MKRIMLVLVVALLLSGLPVAAAQDATPLPTPTSPNFNNIQEEENDCSFLNRSGGNLLTDDVGQVICGTITVPENWSIPKGRQIQIAYAVLVSSSPNPQPDPIVYLSGGPGESALSGIGGYATTFQELRRDRHIVLFDQRGTHFSSPLQCSSYSLDDYIAQQMGSDDSDDDDVDEPVFGPLPDAETLLAQAREAVAENVQRCLDDLAATGVDLSQYNSRASANDTIALMRALGFDQFNLYGISYGTRLALTIMRDHPNSGIRSVVLDSTFPPDINGFERYPTEIHEVVLQLFAACHRDPACNTAYPNLKARFITLLDRLHTNPVMSVAVGEPITDLDVVEVVKQIGSNAQVGMVIPIMIEQLERGDSTAIDAIVSGDLFSDGATNEDAATPEAAATAVAESDAAPDAAATPVVAGADEADTFMNTLGESLASAPISRRSDVLFQLAMLDKGPHTIEALQQFVERAFPGDDEANDREQLNQLIAAMDADGIAQVFASAASLDSLIDLQTLGLSTPVFNTVECNEEIPFEDFAVTVANAQSVEIPQIAYTEVDTIAQQFATCELWNSGAALPVEDEPVVSDIPTLIFSGTYDFQTPPSWNKDAFLGLENATFVQFSATNHGVLVGQNGCASVIAESFFNDPNTLPDLACSNESRPVWVLPDGSVTQPG